MAHVPVDTLDKNTHAELACTYAALILHDDGVEITSEKISKLLAASDNKVESYWPGLFAKALQGRNIGELLVGGGGAPAQASGVSQVSAPADKAGAAKPKAKEVEVVAEPEAAVDMGDLFGGDF